MAGLYQRILTEIEEQPALVLQRRLSLRPSDKAAVLFRASLPRAGRPQDLGFTRDARN
jgi:phytoene/squalene synthetase